LLQLRCLSIILDLNNGLILLGDTVPGLGKSVLILLELAQELSLARLFKPVEVVDWGAFRLWARVNDLASDMPLLCLSDEHLHALSNEGLGGLAGQRVFILLKHDLGVGLCVALQLREGLGCSVFIYIKALTLDAIVIAHDPN